MKKKLKSALSLLLCMIMVFGAVQSGDSFKIISNLVASAAEKTTVDLNLGVLLNSLEINGKQKTYDQVLNEGGFPIYPDESTTINYGILVRNQSPIVDVNVKTIACYFNSDFSLIAVTGKEKINYEMSETAIINNKAYTKVLIKDLYSTAGSTIRLNLKCKTPLGYSDIFSEFYCEIQEIDSNYIDRDSTPGNALADGKFSVDEDDEDAFINLDNMQACPYGLKYQEANNTVKITGYLEGKRLNKLYIPSKINGLYVSSIGNGAFKDTYFDSVFIPSSIKNVGPISNFDDSGSPSPKEIVISEGVKTIESDAFFNCTNLQKINLPESVTKIDTLSINNKEYKSSFLSYGLYLAYDLPNPSISRIDVVRGSYSEDFLRGIKNSDGQETFSKLIEYAPKIYTVNYDSASNGGNWVASETRFARSGEPIDLSLSFLKPGWEFVGWNTNPNATTGLSTLTMGNSDITLYAIYRKILTGTFVDYNGTAKSTRYVSATIYNKATSGTISAPTQNDFKGWTKCGWTIDTSAKATVVSDFKIRENSTYYGIYKRALTLSYNADGGSYTPPSQMGLQYVNSYAIRTYLNPSFKLANSVNKDGYAFNGWAINSVNGKQFNAGEIVAIASNTTLYAVWIKNNYYLTTSDIFSFTNSGRYFRSGTYTVTNSDFNKLSNYVKKIYSPANARTYINRMQELRNSQWVGSCYGMAVASILNKKGQIAFPKNFDPKASTLYDVDAPYQNSAVQSAVNYYFLSQKIPVMRGDSYFNSNANWSAGLKKLVSSVKSGKLTLFCYYWKEVSNGKEEIKGHAIALVGYEEASGGGYNLIAYDNRYGENYITVYVDKNYSSCVVNGVEKPYGIEFLTDFSDFDKIDIDGLNNDMVLNTRSYNQSANTEISVELNGEVTVESKAGQTLTVKNGNISGDMDIISTHMIVKSTPDGSPAPVTLVFEVNDSSAFTFESSSDEISASVTSDKCYASVTATADTVVISENEGIYAVGENVDFSGSLSLNNDVCDMMSFAGSGNGDINLVYADDGVIVNGASGKGTVTVYSDTTSINTAKFNSDYSNIKISGDGTGIAGNVEIAASSDNSGVYDVKIANMQNSKFEFAEKNVSMYYKATKNLAVSSSDKVIYTSSDPDIVSVDSSGNIIALKTGNVTITATNTDTGDVDSCTVNVSYAWWQVLIRILLLGFLWY